MIIWRSHLAYQEIIKKCVEALEPHLSDFDVIIGGGFSGNLVTVPVSAALNKTCIIVWRDPDDGKHGGTSTTIQGTTPCRLNGKTRVLFMDDHISRGNTYRKCLDVYQRLIFPHRKMWERNYLRFYDSEEEATKRYILDYGQKPPKAEEAYFDYIMMYNPDRAFSYKFIPVEDYKGAITCGIHARPKPGRPRTATGQFAPVHKSTQKPAMITTGF